MTTDRFELEQSIMDCWKITDDIAMLEQQGANIADTVSLASVYDYKFQKLWSIFEEMVRDRRIT
jgi:hypothetical protein